MIICGNFKGLLSFEVGERFLRHLKFFAENLQIRFCRNPIVKNFFLKPLDGKVGNVRQSLTSIRKSEGRSFRAKISRFAVLNNQQRM
jgi:hypothetical protein